MDSESDSRGNKFYINEISKTSVTAVCTANNTSFREKPRNAMKTCSFGGNETWSRFHRMFRTLQPGIHGAHEKNSSHLQLLRLSEVN